MASLLGFVSACIISFLSGVHFIEWARRKERHLQLEYAKYCDQEQEHLARDGGFRKWVWEKHPTMYKYLTDKRYS